jgi:glucose-6-phosphate dehydrogenase assembly protein OpcA
MEQVIRELNRLESELRQQHTGEHAHRNTVLNLVTLCDDHDRAVACDGLVRAVAASHPLRAILIHLHDDGERRLSADISVEAYRLPDGVPLQREQVLLEVWGATAAHVASLVEPLLVSDLPTYVWWTGRRHVEAEGLREVLAASKVLVVDSIGFDRPPASMLELAGLTGQLGDRIGFSDLRWERLRPWREAIAQFFGPRDRRPFLSNLREVRLECAASRPADRAGAALIAGWLASALNWRFGRVTSVGADLTEALTDRRVEVSLRSRTAVNVPTGHLVAATLAGRRGRRDFSLRIELDRETGGHALVSIDIGDAKTLNQHLPMPIDDETDILFQVLARGRRDPVFVRSLVAAVPLLEALR